MKETKLSEVAIITMGQSPKSDTYNTEGIGMPLLNGPTEFGLIYPECTLFTTDSKRNCEKGDLIFCVRGSTTGRMNWADRPYSLGRGVCSIRGKSPIETKYIKYCIEYKLPKLLQLAGGATFPNLTSGDLATFFIPYSDNRFKIAAILSAYDDLIENNTRRIKILEEMAQLIYREWFVKFRFPGHEKVRMVESELGPIPEGWEVIKLGEIIEFQKGKKAKNVIDKQYDGFIPYLLIDGLKNYNYTYTDDEKMIIASETDCIMVMDGASSGYVSIGHYGAVGSTLARITVKGVGVLNSYFLYQFLQANYKIISDNNTGSAIPHTNKDFINGMLIPIPPVNVIRTYTDHIEPIFKLTWKLRTKNTILRRTRDLLLPKLISGELDVEDLDIAVGGE